VAGRPKRRAKLAAQRAAGANGFPLQRREAGRAEDRERAIEDHMPTCDSDPKPWEAAAAHLLMANDAEVTTREAAEKAARQHVKSARQEAIEQIHVDDRATQASWWAGQTALMLEERAELARLAGSEVDHPSPQYAQYAATYGMIGMPVELAAKRLGISQGQFEQHYRHDYEIGASQVLSQVATNVLRIAMSSNDKTAIKAGIEFLERRGGEEWRKPAQKIEIDDGRRTKAVVFDSSKLTFEERAQVRAIIERQVRGNAIDVIPTATGLVPLSALEEVEDDE
jgi:hypothetical protein